MVSRMRFLKLTMVCDFIISEIKTLSLAGREQSEDLSYNRSQPLLKGNVLNRYNFYNELL